MPRPPKFRRSVASFPQAAGLFVVLAAFIFVWYRLDSLRTEYVSYRVGRLIRSSETYRRTTKGRLFATPYAPYNKDTQADDDLGRAQLLLLNAEPSFRRDYLQALIHIGTRNWESAKAALTKLASVRPNDARLINDLGVVFLQVSDVDPMYLFKALEEFDLAERRDPRAIEPHYNRLLVLDRLQLQHLQEAETYQYTHLEANGPWHDELLSRSVMEEATIESELQKAIDRHDDAAAFAIFTRSPEVCRTLAMRYGMNSVDADVSEKVAHFIGEMLATQYGDETVSSMLSMLRGDHASELIHARHLVAEGADYYLKADLKRSIDAYDGAAELVAQIDSPFDHLWIDLNRADTLIRLNQHEAADAVLQHVLKNAQAKNFKWIQALALQPYGNVRGLNASFSEMLDRLEQCIRICNEIGAPRASIRARYYMMGQRFFAGDLDGALRIAVDCLNLADASDHLHIASLQTLAGIILYKKGLISFAVQIADESVSQAAQTTSPLLVLGTSAELAAITEANGHRQLADNYLARGEQAVNHVDQPIEKMRAEATVRNTKARLLLSRGNLAEAEQLLTQSRLFFESQPGASIYLSQTWMLLGQTFANAGKVEEAKAAFRKAIDIAENDSNFVKTERLRLAFDDGRREIYDSAIAFEYAHGDPDASWTYVQKYRAKLFIEMLAQFNPAIEKIHTIALDRSRVQLQIPGDLQIVEYALLPDRLLIWVVTKNKFESRSVSVVRADVEQKVADFLTSVRNQRPVEAGSIELYHLFIDPIADLLDPQKSLAIIPDRALHGLPFDAMKGSEGRYLAETFTILESPTLTHLLAVNTTKPRRDRIVTFGSRADDTTETHEIAAMQDMYREVTSVAGAEVTKLKFLTDMERAPIFHYAGHSAHDAVDPLRSAILLDGDAGGPNSVTAVDIVGHKLQPNAVVVLSSCDSSVGNSKDGVGIRGLTSAFLISGAGSVVGSLWPVESSSTSQLMINFHKAFALEHLPVAQALRKAKLQFLTANRKRSHPYYWSGFVVTGNFSALH